MGSIPAPIAGCPTSRSFFARCGIPQALLSSLSRAPQLRTGAPCSHQRTWAENDGRSPSTAFRSGPHHLFFRTDRSVVDLRFLLVLYSPLSFFCFDPTAYCGVGACCRAAGCALAMLVVGSGRISPGKCSLGRSAMATFMKSIHNGRAAWPPLSLSPSDWRLS